MKRILVVEDEAGIARLLQDYLEQAGFAVLLASDGAAANVAIASQAPDLVVLDLGLPGGIDGLDVLRQLRKRAETPVIILTARGDETDRVVGLELGADDYVVKPFSPKEVVARVRAIFRRTETRAVSDSVLTVGSLLIEPARMRVTRDGSTIELTATEFQLLETMAREPGRVFTRSQLLDAVRGVAFESYERAIDTHIKNLRKKIEPNPSEPSFIHTVFGVGYRCEAREP